MVCDKNVIYLLENSEYSMKFNLDMSYSKCLGPRVFEILENFWILEYLLRLYWLRIPNQKI